MVTVLIYQTKKNDTYIRFGDLTHIHVSLPCYIINVS